MSISARKNPITAETQLRITTGQLQSFLIDTLEIPTNATFEWSPNGDLVITYSGEIRKSSAPVYRRTMADEL